LFSVTANPGAPNAGSALQGIGNAFANAMGLAQMRAAAQIRPDLFGDASASGTAGIP
jgi:hypothetical protein